MKNKLVFALVQNNPTIGDLVGNQRQILDIYIDHRDNADVIAFPELSLTGYYPEDLMFKPSFIAAVDAAIQHIVAQTTGHDCTLIVAAPSRIDDKLYNTAYIIRNGQIIKAQHKYELPNYGIFDEKRYFTPGSLPDVTMIEGVPVGFAICEDLWLPAVAAHLKKQGAAFLFSINASPYEYGKHPRRYSNMRKRVQETGLPLFYINQVGGQDDLICDGSAFALDKDGHILWQEPPFVETLNFLTVSKHGDAWEIEPLTITPALQREEEIYRGLTLALKDYVRKNNIPGILLGMSGGIDSALSAAIAVDAIGADKVHSVMMPSRFTSSQSVADAEDCAKRLGIAYESISIAPMMEAFEQSLPNLKGLAHENMQARMRGNILMSLSNQTGWMVLTTGNKSEVAVGYCTLYGDMCGGFNVLKDVYKTDVFALARWRNKQGPVIPDQIITKAPTAELRDNQTDQDSLPPYDILDAILKGLIEQELGLHDLIAQGYDAETVRKVLKLLDFAQYKRLQSAPGPKVTAKAFSGRDRRYPITNGYTRLSTD